MAGVPRILIVDDDRALLRALAGFMEKMGLEPVLAESAEAALEAAQAQLPELALLDLIMPGIGGFELCQRLRALPGGGNLQVLVMSGLLGSSQVHRAFLAGAVGCLNKPIQFEELEARIRTHLAILQQAEELRRALTDSSAMNRNLVKLNEQLARSEAIKTRFLALMRAEIYNPLSDLIGLADRVADPAVAEPDARALAQRIRLEAQALDDQIQNVFTAAELEAGEAEPAVTRVEVGSVVEDVVASYRPIAEARCVSLVADLQGDLVGLHADGGMLRHILANLVSNAVRYGQGPVRIGLEVLLEGLVMRVADSGPGIPATEQPHLFAPFQARLGAVKRERGLGLGLPVARSLAELLGGSLKVTTGPQGTEVTVHLPHAAPLADVEAEVLDGNILFFDEPHEF